MCILCELTERISVNVENLGYVFSVSGLGEGNTLSSGPGMEKLAPSLE